MLSIFVETGSQSAQADGPWPASAPLHDVALHTDTSLMTGKPVPVLTGIPT